MIINNNPRIGVYERMANGTDRKIGFVYLTLGGFWRAYSFATSSGYGPLSSQDTAEKFVWERHNAGER